MKNTLRILSLCAFLLISCNRYSKHPLAKKMNGLWLIENYKAEKLISSDTLEILLLEKKLQLKYLHEDGYNTFKEPSFEDNTIRYHIFKNDTITYYEYKEVDLDEFGNNYIEDVQYEGGATEGWKERTVDITLRKIIE